MNTITYNCPHCGANIVDLDAHHEYTCPYCSSTFTLDQVQAIVDEKLKNVQQRDQKNKEFKETATTYTCKNCGAQVISDTNTVATFCLYCHSQNIVVDRASNDLAPDKILPFTVTKDKALQGFQSWVKGVSFLPDDFCSDNQLQKLTTLYAPFWLFNYHADFEVSGTGTKLRHWSANSYRYTETSYYSVHKKGSLKFNPIPIDGSIALNNNTMAKLEPFDLSKLEDFKMAYLVGHYADTYDDDKDKIKADLEAQVNMKAQNQVHSITSGYATFKSEVETAKLVSDYDSYALLPLWFLNYKYNGEDYVYTMNGQTGKVVGDLPIDLNKQKQYKTKVFFIAYAIFAILAVISAFTN